MGSRRLDFYLERLIAEEQFSFYRGIADFADAEIAPHLLEWERSGVLLPREAIDGMARLGLFGIAIDEEYGGQGGGLTELVLMGLAIGYHSHSAAITPGAAVSLGAKPIAGWGSDAQRREHLGDLASGRRMVVFGLSEPGRGSDAANPQVAAERSGDHWVIRGEKCWSTNAAWASHVVVHALTAPAAPNGKRSTCFIVPVRSPGVHYEEMSGKTVWRQSSTGSITFDGVKVSSAQILGELHGGFKIMVNTLNGGRLFIAGLALASLAFALDKVRRYAQERRQFGDQPIARFQRVQDVVLEMDIALERNLSWLMHLAREFDAGKATREQFAKVKIDSSRVASHLLVEAMEICGGVACLDEFGLSRHHNDLFVTRVGEGSNRALMTFSARPLFDDCADLLQ
ncbi:MAG: acyl-CoA dehydrogenase family protein [Planctomycetes bacterium]|nr:acyl-CoA dehydrogenase family protein [Planctomycetota bacterium]